MLAVLAAALLAHGGAGGHTQKAEVLAINPRGPRADRSPLPPDDAYYELMAKYNMPIVERCLKYTSDHGGWLVSEQGNGSETLASHREFTTLGIEGAGHSLFTGADMGLESLCGECGGSVRRCRDSMSTCSCSQMCTCAATHACRGTRLCKKPPYSFFHAYPLGRTRTPPGGHGGTRTIRELSSTRERILTCGLTRGFGARSNMAIAS